MPSLTDNFFNPHKPLQSPESFYKRYTICLSVSSVPIIIFGQILALSRPSDFSTWVPVILLGLMFSIWGLFSHACWTKSNQEYWPLVYHLVALALLLANVIVQFSGDKEPHLVRTGAKFLELGLFSILVAALVELAKRSLTFAQDSTQIIVVVTSVEYEFDYRANCEVLVVAYHDTKAEISTPLRIAKHEDFEKLTPGSKLRITFRTYPDNIRRIEKIEVLGMDSTTFR